MRRWVFPLLAMLLLTVPILAAAERATITGTVMDESKAVIPNVVVRAIDLDRNQVQETLSNDMGFYSFPSLLIGNYKLEASLEGFQKFEQSGIRLHVGDNVRINVSLKVGSISNVVTVEADAEQVNTANASLGQVINDKIISRMPLNGRNFVQLASLTPGVNRGAPGNTFDGSNGNAETMRYYWAGGSSISANGVRENQNNFTLDGVDNNEAFVGTISIFPNLDAIAEFKVETNNASAEYGRAGGAVVNATIKSGTNQYHGTVFEFLRNDVFDANSWENNKNGNKRNALRQNQFGFTFGGPIVKDKTFFFTDYQGLRLRIPAADTVNVPTLAQRNPASYTGTVDPVAIAYLRAFPEPNVVGSDNRYYSADRARVTTSDQFDVRVDHSFSSDDSIFGRFSYSRDHTVMGSKLPLPLYAGWGSGDNKGNTRGAAFGYTHLFSPRLVNETRVGFHRVLLGWYPTNYGLEAAKDIGIPNVNYDVLTSGMPLIHVEGLEWVGDYGPYTLPENNYSFNDNISWVKGNHSLKFGISLVRRQQNYFQQQWAKGIYEFNSVNDLVTGTAYHVGKGALHGTFGLRTWEYGAFVQDDWKVTPRLTLNLGLRWDIFPASREVCDRMSNFDPVHQVMVLSGGDSFVNTDWNNFGPRAGFAWSLTGDGKTVIRAGYGIYYSPENGGLDSSLASNYPYTNVWNYNSGGVYRLGTGIPWPAAADPNHPAGVLKWHNPDNRTPYIQQWNATFEREVVPDLLLSASYVGTRGTKLAALRNINIPPLVNGVIGVRPYSNVSDNIMAYEFRANSFYNGLQIKADKRFAHGFSILASYTWSHAIDDSPGAFSGNGTGGQGAEPQDSYNLAAERGNAGYDIRHRLSVSYLWDLPFGKGRPFGANVPNWADAIIGGWQLNGIFTYQSGSWFTPNVWGRMGDLGGIVHWGTSRPDRIGNGNLNGGDRSPNHWFDYAAFDDKSGEPIHYGNAGRNILVGPGVNTMDMALFKNFKIWENQKLEFRWEVFNLFNHPQFNLPNASVNTESWNGDLGKITGTRMASWRIMQLSLKYVF